MFVGLITGSLVKILLFAYRICSTNKCFKSTLRNVLIPYLLFAAWIKSWQIMLSEWYNKIQYNTERAWFMRRGVRGTKCAKKPSLRVLKYVVFGKELLASIIYRSIWNGQIVLEWRRTCCHVEPRMNRRSGKISLPDTVTIQNFYFHPF